MSELFATPEHAAPPPADNIFSRPFEATRSFVNEPKDGAECHDALLDMAPQMVWITDANGNNVFVNRYWTEFTGLSPEQSKNKGWLQALHPDDVEPVQQRWQETVNGSDLSEIELRYRRATDGAYRYFLSRRVPIRDAQGVTTHWLGIGIDIQERKAVEAELRDSEEQLRVITEGAGIATWKWDPVHDRILYQRNVDVMYGVPGPLQSYAQLIPLVHPDDMPGNLAAIEHSMATGENFTVEYRVCRPDSTIMWVAAVASVIRESDGSLAFAGIKMDITARKAVESNLKESESRYKALAEAGAHFVWINRADGYTIYVNPQWTAFTGLSQEATTGAGWMDVLHPDDRERVRQSYLRAREQEIVHETQLRYRRAADGAYRWHLVRSTPLRDENGAVQNWLGVAVDIHAQKTAEEQARRSEERYRALVQAASNVVWSQGAGELDAVGQRWWAEFTGQSPTSADNQNNFGWIEAIHPDDREIARAAWNNSLHTREAYDVTYRIRHHSGEYRTFAVRGVPIYDADGALREWVGTMTDITEATRADEALRESEARFRAMADTAPVLIWMAGLDRSCYYFNKPWLDFTGRPLQDEVGNGWVSGVHADDVQRCLEIYQSSFDARAGFETEYRLRRHDGRFRWILAHGVPRFTPDGAFLGFIGSCIDIEERKQAEEENVRLLREAQEASRLKDEFLAVVSHELRTPLNAILGWAHLCNSGGIGADEIPHALGIIERNARAQAQIVEDILDMARVVTGKMRIDTTPVALDEVAREVVESVRPAAEAKSIALYTTFAPDLPPLPGDAGRLRQVMWNLLSNAIKFTPQNGTISLVIERTDGALELLVSDTGQGIEPQFLPFVFDRFRQADGGTTRRHGGLGLGLALARHLVEAHGGSIQVHSDGIGHGSTFLVRLPINAPAPPDQNLSAHPHPAPVASPTYGALHSGKLASKRILVVDDAPDALEFIASLLHRNGATVETAANATEARHRIETQAFDLVLSDLGMPGEDGYSLLTWIGQRAASQPKPLPVVALTAYASIEERARTLAAGFVAFVAKPVESDELIETIVRSLKL